MVNHTASPSSLIRYSLKLMFVWLVLSVALTEYGDVIGKIVLPFYRWTLSHSNYYHVQSLLVQERHDEKMIQLTVLTGGSHTVADKPIPAGYPMTASTLLAHMYQPIIVTLSILLVWPMRWPQRTGALLSAIVMLPLLLQLDVPIVLLGSLDDFIWYALKPELINPVWSIRWMNVMNGGGRLFLAILLAVVLATVWHPVWLSRFNSRNPGELNNNNALNG